MATIGEVYNPLIEARHDADLFTQRLVEVGTAIMTANPDKCKTLEDGIEAAKRNLDYYCQYFDDSVATETKKAMGYAGTHWVSLGGHVVENSYPAAASNCVKETR